MNDPQSSEEVPLTDPVRFAEIDRKHQIVAQYLVANQLDALLLQKPANLAWFTGVDELVPSSLGRETGPIASLFITPESRIVITSNSDSDEIFDRMIPGLGFQLKQRPWHEPRIQLVQDICRTRKVISDNGPPSAAEALLNWRTQFTPREAEQIRQLGRLVAHAVEATCRNFPRGSTEFEIAGELSHRLLKHRVTPVQIRVQGDGRGERYRGWNYSVHSIRNYGVVSALGRQNGLHVGVTRTVAFEPVNPRLEDCFEKVTLITATAIYFTYAEITISEIWTKLQRIYEKAQVPEEWRKAEIGGIIGYEPVEKLAAPNETWKLKPIQAIHWSPSVGPARIGETLLLSPDVLWGVTSGDQWPVTSAEIRGQAIPLPAILIREE